MNDPHSYYWNSDCLLSPRAHATDSPASSSSLTRMSLNGRPDVLTSDRMSAGDVSRSKAS